MVRVLLTSLFIIHLFTAPALAQNFTAEGADKVKVELQKWVDQQMKLMNIPDPEVEQAFTPITAEGDITVVPEDGYYAAKLPFMTLAVSPDRRIELGQIAMNIVPETKNSDIWGMTMAMPKTMPVINEIGENVGKLDIGSQRFKGRFDTARHIFLQYELAYADIYGEEKNEDRTSILKINRIKSSQDLKEMPDNPELYSGPIDFKAEGIEAMLSGEDTIKLTVKDMEAHTNYAQIPLFDAEAFQNDVLQYTEPDSKMSDKDFVTKVFETVRFMPNNAKSDFIMRDLAVTSIDEDGENKMTAESVQFGSFGRELKTDNAGMGISYKVSGLDFAGLPETYEPYLPYLSQFNAEVKSLPLLSLLDLLETGTTSALDQNNDMSEEQRSKMMDMTFNMMAPLLAKHKTHFVIGDSKTLAPDFALTMSGDITASGASPRGFVGDLLIQIKGMDDAVNTLRKTMQENEESRLFLQQIMLPLTMVQSIGDLDETQHTRTYKFEFNEAGDVFVNGTNFGAFMGSMAH